MAKIAAFKAVRPIRDKVHLVPTRPYYSYKKNVLKAKLEDNPYTFLHIINPEFAAAKKTKANSPERFAHVKEQYDAFRQDGILIEDAQAHLYIYRQSQAGFTVQGFFAGVSVDDYLNGHVKRHEQTLTAREDIFTNYLDIVGFNAEPVLMTYAPDAQLQAYLDAYSKLRPEYEFTTTDRITHELWVVSLEDSAHICQLFAEIDSLYIADGHHRSASSARYVEQKRAAGIALPEAATYFLSYLVPENQVRISPFHRLLQSLNGLSAHDFLSKLSKIGQLSEISQIGKPDGKHCMHIYLQQKSYAFIPHAALINESDPVEKLDAYILSALILNPFFGITDLKTSTEVAFVPGNESLESIVQTVDSAKFEVAFILQGLSMKEVKDVADANLNMPPKSTWVEPKLRSGLTIYTLHP
ncbi:MAG: hypothetical protein RLZZ301_1202 [Bacteroidota bacterium]|jgi:uncharacterized protein (DUF1015 family)